MSTQTNPVISLHQSSGHYITIDGINTFYLDQGSGPVVFCIHGVPTSSFLYRKVVPQLQKRGFRAIAIDLPGLGLSDRPENFEYTFRPFAAFCHSFLAALHIDRVHLLLHDIGGPIGLCMAAEHKPSIQSITVLNAMLDVEHFVKPLPMRPFETPVLGEAELALLTPLTFPLLMNGAGVVNSDVLSHQETAAYIHLMKRGDGGQAFLRIMRGFDQTKAFSEACYAAWISSAYPVQLIWGEHDPLLPYEEQGKPFEAARPGLPVTKVESKHFLPEEAYETIASKVKELVSTC